MAATPMNDIDIRGTQSIPRIVSSRAEGLLRMDGDSYPENSYELFGPVIEWVEDYLAREARPLLLDLSLLYLNTSSIRAMMDIFDLLQAAHEGGRQVAVRWRYDRRNERVRELAEEFAEDCSFPFRIEPSAIDCELK